MKLLRSGLAGCFFVAFAVGGVLLGIGLLPLVALFTFAFSRRFSGGGCTYRELIAKRNRRLIRAAYRLFVEAARITGLFKVVISPADRERLAALRGVVVAANHISLIDVVILIAFLGDTTSIAKAAASRNPFYGAVVRTLFLVNDEPDKVLAEAGKLLARGVNLIVFPEGTRIPAAAPVHRLRRGAAQIALAANAPLAAVKISSNPTVLGKGQPWHEVGAHDLVYTLEYRGMIAPGGFENAAKSRHAAAVALTAEIGKALFGGKHITDDCIGDKK